MIYAPIYTSCWKVSTDKDVDLRQILTLHLHDFTSTTDTPAWNGLCHNMGGPKEQCVSLKITQLMLHKFTVDENVDRREITAKT